jgi:NADPH:quinone reductase-like Zn-dependent oxidoreductase
VTGLAGVAAHDALVSLDVQTGEIVLISDARRGRSVAVQLASAAGATVIATAPGREQEYLRSLSAARTVDNTRDLVAAVRKIAWSSSAPSLSAVAAAMMSTTVTSSRPTCSGVAASVVATPASSSTEPRGDAAGTG